VCVSAVNLSFSFLSHYEAISAEPVPHAFGYRGPRGVHKGFATSSPLHTAGPAPPKRLLLCGASFILPLPPVHCTVVSCAT
jgi:hypothetical protein